MTVRRTCDWQEMVFKVEPGDPNQLSTSVGGRVPHQTDRALEDEFLISDR